MCHGDGDERQFYMTIDKKRKEKETAKNAVET